MGTIKTSEYCDRELLEKYGRDHNNLWIGVLLDRYLHLIFGVCMKYLKNEEEAKDFTQQICLEVLKTLPKHHVTYFKSWLYQVAKNHCLMEIRKAHRIEVVPLSPGEDRIGYDETGDQSENPETVEYRESQLQDALKRLKDAQKRCVDLFYLQSKTYQEVSDETGFTLMQVKSHIQNGKRNLKMILQKLVREEAGNVKKDNDF